MRSAAWLLVGLGLSLSGCGSEIKGEIDGDAPEAIRDGFWYDYSYEIEGEDRHLVVVEMVNFSDACEQVAAARAVAVDAEQEEDNEDYVEGMEEAQSMLPEEYWRYQLLLGDDEVSAKRYDLDGEEGLFIAVHQEGYTDYGPLLDGDEPDIDQEVFYSEDGEITIEEIEAGGSLRASGTAELEDEDEDDAGDIELTLREPYCEAMADLLEEELESIDTDTGSNNGCGAPTIESYDYSCGGGSCTMSVTASAPMGGVTWTVIDTGDPGYSCGPKGGLECGVWMEIHDEFEVIGSPGACREIRSLTLEVVDNFQNQVDNESTLFDTESVTILIEIEDTRGSISDCEVDGDDPSHFASDCAN